MQWISGWISMTCRDLSAVKVTLPMGTQTWLAGKWTIHQWCSERHQPPFTGDFPDIHFYHNWSTPPFLPGFSLWAGDLFRSFGHPQQHQPFDAPFDGEPVVAGWGSRARSRLVQRGGGSCSSRMGVDVGIVQRFVNGCQRHKCQDNGHMYMIYTCVCVCIHLMYICVFIYIYAYMYVHMVLKFRQSLFHFWWRLVHIYWWLNGGCIVSE